MADYNYTDLEESGGVPLGQLWERAAIKDISDILHYLTHGLFFNPADFAERLRQSADAIEVPITELHHLPRPPLPPDEAADLPDWNMVMAVISAHLNAVKIASDALGIPVDALLSQGVRAAIAQTPAELSAIAEQALGKKLEDWIKP